MKIPIKNLNEVKTPDNGVLLFVDQDDNLLKGKKSNNEVLDFSNNSMKFYKCTSVDTENKTWTGYELILEDSVYNISDVITEGLIYGDAFTPIIGSSYNSTANVIVTTWNGVFGYSYIKFVSNLDVTSGDSLQITKGSNFFFDTIDGHQCMNMNGHAATYHLQDFTCKSATFSIWGHKSSTSNGTNGHFMTHFGSDTGGIMLNSQGIWVSKLNEQWFNLTSSSSWVHFVLRFMNGTLNIFCNGENCGKSQSFDFTKVIDAIGIGDCYRQIGVRICHAYAADFRIFNRALSDEEITALFNAGIQA